MKSNRNFQHGGESRESTSSPEFDAHADTYDEYLNNALALSGENKEFFARERVRWLAHCLLAIGEHPEIVLDYGCGIGDTCVNLRETLHIRSFLGLDVSSRSIQLAKLRHGSNDYRFSTFDEFKPNGSFDMAYCNGVFHHIAPDEREWGITYIRRCLRSGGLFAFWENNPWNPGTRLVMRRCVFDRDAVTIPPTQARTMLEKGGFEILRIDFKFFFPTFLKVFRFLEARMHQLPLGGQYQILCRKPERSQN